MAKRVESPYLARKEIDLDELVAACGSRVFAKKAKISIHGDDDEISDHHEGVFLFRELVDATGKGMGFERILDEKVQRYPDKKAGDKYLTGGASTSGFTPIGFSLSELPHLSGKVVVVCGLADGYRVHESTGLPVVCGVGEPSLPKLAKMIDTAANCFGERADVLVAADNDKAGKAAAMRTGYRWVVPETHKDWSDVYRAEGAHAVRMNLAREQEPVPADELPDRLAELGINIGGNTNTAKGGDNHWLEGQASEGGLLRPVTVEIGARHEIDGIEQYMALLAHIGAASSTTAKRIEANSLEPHALVVSMLSDGLLPTLPPTEQEHAESHAANVMDLVSQGKLDDVEVVLRSPVLMAAGKDDSGRAALRFNSAYDERLKEAFRSCRGYWDKEKREWVVPAGNQADLDAALDVALKAASGRLVVQEVSGTNGAPGFITGTPERAQTIKEAVLPVVQMVWDSQPEEPVADAQASDGAVEFSVGEQGGWPSVSIAVPFQAKELREELKAMGAKFNGKEKVWQLALRDEVLDKLDAWKAKTTGPQTTEIRQALEVCGFGHLEPVDRDTLAMSAPYHAPLIDRLKEGLPRLARRFDKESKSWHVDVSSAVVAHELHSIAAEFDLRLLDAGGQPLPRETGWDAILGNGGAKPQQGASEHQAARASNNPAPRMAAGGPGL